MNTAPPSPPPETGRPALSRLPRRRSWSSRLAVLVRWLHLYLSLFGFATLIFFSLTGITLNHPNWLLGTAERRTQAEGAMNTQWLQPRTLPAADKPANAHAFSEDHAAQLARLEIVEFLRREHQVRGAVSDFRADEFECMVAFQGPGYSATAFIDRANGRYDMTIVDQGSVALINDLHKGRHTGGAWSLVIDISAIVMALAGLTGLLLLLYMRRRRISGLITTLIGAIALVAIFVWLVP